MASDHANWPPCANSRAFLGLAEAIYFFFAAADYLYRLKPMFLVLDSVEGYGRRMAIPKNLTERNRGGLFSREDSG